MKESQFNLYFTAPDGVRLAFNSLSCALAIVDNDYNSWLCHNKWLIFDEK